MSKLEKYKVVVRNGKNFAPPIYVEAEKASEAEKEAKEKSGLSRFESWTFNAFRI